MNLHKFLNGCKKCRFAIVFHSFKFSSRPGNPFLEACTSECSSAFIKNIYWACRTKSILPIYLNVNSTMHWITGLIYGWPFLVMEMCSNRHKLLLSSYQLFFISKSVILSTFIISTFVIYSPCMYVCICWSGKDRLPKNDHIAFGLKSMSIELYALPSVKSQCRLKSHRFIHPHLPMNAPTLNGTFRWMISF